MGVVRNGGPIGIFGNPETVYGRKKWMGPQLIDGPQVMEDFLGEDFPAGWGQDADAGCSVAIAAAHGGVVALTTDATDDDRVHICGELQWYPNKQLYFETRVKLDVITTAHVVVGLTDAKGEASQLLPVSRSGTTWTTTATDFIGFNYDTDATDAEWHGMAVANNTDATATDSGEAPVAGTWVKLAILVQADGATSFLVYDVAAGSIAAPASTIATALCPFVGLQNRGAVAHVLSVDYIFVASKRS